MLPNSFVYFLWAFVLGRKSVHAFWKLELIAAFSCLGKCLKSSGVLPDPLLFCNNIFKSCILGLVPTLFSLNWGIISMPFLHNWEKVAFISSFQLKSFNWLLHLALSAISYPSVPNSSNLWPFFIGSLSNNSQCNDYLYDVQEMG